MSKSGIVYKLCCVDTDITEEYIGSTKNFTRRRTEHKSRCHHESGEKYNFYLYQFIRENGGWDNWRMIQLEAVKYDTKRDLEAHERRWIEQLKPELNKNMPGRTRQEYYKQNKEEMDVYYKEYKEQNTDKIKKYQKEYRGENKEKMDVYYKEYREQNKDKIKKYREENKDKIKKYREENKDKIKEYQKEYRGGNKNKIKDKHKVKCIYCDIELRKNSLYNHNNTQKHIYNYIYY